MGVARAQHRDQAHQLAFRHLTQHRRGQFLADQDGVVGIHQRLRTGLLEVGQQTATEVFHVRGAFAQVVVVHQFEPADVLADHLAQGALGPLAGLDDVSHLTAEGCVLKHHQVHVEQRAFFRAQLGGQFGRKLAHVGAHALEGVVEQFEFSVDVFDRLVRHHLKVGRRQHDHGSADGSTRRAWYADEARFLDALALAAQATDRAGGLGVSDNPGELSAHGDQESFFTLVELAAFFLLNDQHADHTTVVDDRCTQEGRETLLARFSEVAVTWVISGVFQVQRLFPGTDQTNQAFVGGHADLADGSLVEAFGGHQHEAVGFRVEQVDRADLAAHGLLDAQDNDPQRRLEIFGGVHFLDDLAQRIEHGSGSNSVVSRASAGAGQAL
ncbi:hypothetical protein D3C78_626990 [compost metagenome]